MKYDLIIWDFNGTILDDTELCVNAINQVLTKRNLPVLKDVDAMRQVFCFPCKEYYRRVGIDFSKEDYSVPADEWVLYYNSHIDEAGPVEGIYETLADIKKMGIPQIILSASEINMMKGQLEKLEATEYFDDILGADNVYAVGKTSIAKNWLEKSREYSKILFIGDTDHDYHCSLELRCDCILYSGGFMSKERLEKFGVPVISSIHEVINFIC